ERRSGLRAHLGAPRTEAERAFRAREFIARLVTSGLTRELDLGGILWRRAAGPVEPHRPAGRLPRGAAVAAAANARQRSPLGALRPHLDGGLRRGDHRRS